MKNGALRNAMIITTKIIDVEGGLLVPVAGFFNNTIIDLLHMQNCNRKE